jgi:hypothetical protein
MRRTPLLQLLILLEKKMPTRKNHKYNTDKYELFDVKYYLIIRSKVGEVFDLVNEVY